MQQVIKRQIYIDILRGMAVLTMIFAHMTNLFWIDSSSNGLSQFVNLFGQFGGIVSFSVFLFLSGVAIKVSYLSQIDFNDKVAIYNLKIKFILKAIKLLFAYYVIAVLSVIIHQKFWSQSFDFYYILDAITSIFYFKVVPPFVEFILTFSIFYFLVAFSTKFFFYLSKNLVVNLSFSILLWILAYLVQVSEILENLHFIRYFFILFVGDINNVSGNVFPVLLYFFVFSLGLSFGGILISNIYRRQRNVILLLSTILLLLLFMSVYLLNSYFPSISLFRYTQYDARFPPTFGFFVFSSFLGLLFISSYSFLEKYVSSFIKMVLFFIGKNSMGFFVFHTVLIFLFTFLERTENSFIFYSSDNPVTLITLYLLLILLTTIFVVVKNTLKKNVNSTIQMTPFSKEFWFLQPSFLKFFLFFAGIFLIFSNSVLANSYQKTFDEKSYVFKKILLTESSGFSRWWNNNFMGYVQIELQDNYDKGRWLTVYIDLNDERLLSKTGDFSDFVLVRYNDDYDTFIDIPASYHLKNKYLMVKFKNVTYTKKLDDKYFIYFGSVNPYPRKITNEIADLELGSDIKFKSIYINNITSSINKKWHIKKISRAFNEATLEFEVKTNNVSISNKVSCIYVVEGTNLKGKMQPLGNGVYRSSIKVSDLDPGVYNVVGYIYDYADGIKLLTSQSSIFYVTYPLYVTWTMDWEGWDVADNDLNEIAYIANKYKVPITHFFNPRIYIDNQYTVKQITEERAQYLTRWVSDRKQKYFEEVGMHMHMWGDMVAEVGIIPKNQYIVGTYGVDVPTYVYSEDELFQIFDWGRRKLAENGLGVPISYRSGAWMSGVHVLRAAEKAGFKIDSSGRTPGPVNPSISTSTKVPWNLRSTTRPYLPNKDDINAWSAPLKDRMKIWEFPNNGADSYWFSLNDLISRFNDNYMVKNQIMYYPQVVNYLSHPHWFINVDKWKIRGLFDYLEQFLLSNDRGPVVYETLERIYAEWEKDKFYNGS